MLLGTALASSLIALPALTASPAQAQTATCVGVPNMPGPTPILQGPQAAPIICVNGDARVSNAASNNNAIDLRTNGAGNYIDLTNSGALMASSGAGDAAGIFAETAFPGGNSLVIENAGSITVNASLDGYGIYARASAAFSEVSVANGANISVSAGDDGFALNVRAAQPDSRAFIDNSGDLFVTGGDRGFGIYAIAGNARSALRIVNSGDIVVDAGGRGFGIYADVAGSESTLSLFNSGAIAVSAVDDAYGIYATVRNQNSSLVLENIGDVVVRSAADAFGIRAESGTSGAGDNSPITVINSGNLQVTGGGDGYGISAFSDDSVGSPASIMNSGDIAVVSAGNYAYAIHARSQGASSAVTITNSGDLSASSAGLGRGISATTVGANSPITIVNSGDVFGDDAGIYSRSVLTSTTITILAGGSISAGSGLAIDVDDAAAFIGNAGLITGFIDLTDNADSFVNQPGGVFQAGGTSVFGMGNDVFTNQVGGVVDTANNPGADEMVSFEGLETFQNFGAISLLDGAPGDLFTISNTVGGTDLNYIAGSFLAVDAFLGGPGSSSDIFRIDGNVAGVTDVIVNNTNPLPGTFNPVGITVVQVRGSVDPSAFRLANGPIDTGFFNFDLFTENDGTFTNFELRSFPGAGAQLLPQLITAAQDIWHQTSDTWFDRSADLRTQLWRNGGSVAGVPGAMYLGGGSGNDGVVVEQGGLSPAVWARVSHGELEQDGSARTNAFGRSFTFDLNRELYIIDVQSGVDTAVKGVLNPSDVLLLSVFGGGVSANLQYDQLDRRRFDYDGGQVGVAATYLSGGLFVDALFNAQFLELDPNALGFAESLDSNAYGFRIDSGYRFGMGSGGLFLEPLLTLAYVNSDLDGFSFAGNTVSFQDEGSLRGRVGLRAGTSLFIESVRFEPFVIASYWGELSDDDNRATLVSSGTRFGFRDEREDGWGEVSLGTNTFLAGNNALSAFSKIDIIFGDDTEGYIAQSGFRVQW